MRQFNNRFFIWSYTITLVALTIFYQYLTKTVYPDKIYNTVNKTLYLDRNFSEEEKEIIIEAAYEWSTATHHIVNYDIVSLPTEHIKVQSGIIIIKASEDYPGIITLDLINNNHSTLGYYHPDDYIPSIWLIVDRIDDKYYKAIVLHELGHSLGLEHNKDLDGIDTLMYPIIDLSADHITDIDLKNFCKLYNCKYKGL